MHPCLPAGAAYAKVLPESCHYHNAFELAATQLLRAAFPAASNAWPLLAPCSTGRLSPVRLCVARAACHRVSHFGVVAGLVLGTALCATPA